MATPIRRTTTLIAGGLPVAGHGAVGTGCGQDPQGVTVRG